MRILLRIGARAYLDGTLSREAARARDRQRLIEELVREEFGTSDEA